MTETKKPLWYLFLLLKNRWFMVKGILLVMIPTVAITFMMKPKYTVKSVIMPPEEEMSSGLSMLGLDLTGASGTGGGTGFALPLMTTLSDVYEEILKSRSLLESVILSTSFIDSTNLRSMYDRNHELGMYWARMKFRQNYTAAVTPTGFLRVEFTNRNPWYAVEVMEAVIVSLDSINNEIAVSRNRQSRLFLEQRYAMAEDKFNQASEAMREFQDLHELVAPENEMAGYINRLASLKTQYANLITEIAALRQGISGISNASILAKEREATQLMRVIDMLESGIPAPGYEDVLPSISLDEFSELRYEYAILKADYETALRVMTSTRLSLEETILAENREMSRVRVLDPPRHPGWKSKPKKSLIWLEVFLLTFLTLFFFLIARENLREVRRRRPELWEPWQKLMEEIKGDFRFGRKKRT